MTKPTVVQSKIVSGAGVSSVSVSFDSTPTSTRAIGVFVASWSGVPTTVTDNQSNTYTSAAYITNGGSGISTAIFVAPNVNASGTFTVTVNFSGSSDYTVIIAEFSGVVTASPTEAANTASGTGTAASVNTSGGGLSDADAIVIGIVTHDYDTITITETYTLIRENESNVGTQAGAAQYRLPNASGSSSLAWTIGNGAANWITALVVLKPAVGASTWIPRLMLLGVG